MMTFITPNEKENLEQDCVYSISDCKDSTHIENYVSINEKEDNDDNNDKQESDVEKKSFCLYASKYGVDGYHETKIDGHIIDTTNKIDMINAICKFNDSNIDLE